jgi:hypothetical protein
VKHTGQSLGSVAYRPPKPVKGEPKADRKNIPRISTPDVTCPTSEIPWDCNTCSWVVIRSAEPSLPGRPGRPAMSQLKHASALCRHHAQRVGG